jgi:hypothetical protein
MRVLSEGPGDISNPVQKARGQGLVSGLDCGLLVVNDAQRRCEHGRIVSISEATL